MINYNSILDAVIGDVDNGETYYQVSQLLWPPGHLTCQMLVDILSPRKDHRSS